MIKRIDLATDLETIKYWRVYDNTIYLCCHEGWRYWSYRGPYHCERDLVSTWLVINDEINQIIGGKKAPAWVYHKMQNKLMGIEPNIIEDFNDEIPF